MDYAIVGLVCFIGGIAFNVWWRRDTSSAQTKRKRAENFPPIITDQDGDDEVAKARMRGKERL